jgi:hypothetical protein
MFRLNLLDRRTFGSLLLSVAYALGVRGMLPSTVHAADPPFFNHQVDFSTEYTIRPTPPGFRGGTSAETFVSWNWQTDGRGRVTVSLAVDRAKSWVLDWVFKPQAFGFTANDAARLHAHEQIHFDLPALALREFQTRATGLPPDKAQALANDLLGPMGKRVQDLDAVYEKSTGKLFTSPVQDLWTKQIAALKRNPNGTFSQLRQWAQQNFPGQFSASAKKRLPTGRR